MAIQLPDDPLGYASDPTYAPQRFKSAEQRLTALGVSAGQWWDAYFQAITLEVTNPTPNALYVAFDQVMQPSGAPGHYHMYVPPWTLMSRRAESRYFTLWQVAFSGTQPTGVILVRATERDEPPIFQEIPQPNLQRPVQAVISGRQFYATSGVLSLAANHQGSIPFATNLPNLVACIDCWVFSTPSNPPLFAIDIFAGTGANPTAGDISPGNNSIYLPAGMTSIPVDLPPSFTINYSNGESSAMSVQFAMWGY
jgi:hypothetical protein